MTDIGSGRGEHTGGVLDLLLNHAEVLLGAKIIRIDSNAAQRALAAALVMFALDVGSMTVVAEGVETESELSTVATLGIDAVQGFYLARPTDAAPISALRSLK